MSRLTDREKHRDTRFNGIEETAAAVTLKRYVRDLSISFFAGVPAGIAVYLLLAAAMPPQCPVNFNCIPTVMVTMSIERPAIAEAVAGLSTFGTFIGAP